MRVVLPRKMFALVLCVLLAACGGSGDEAVSDSPVAEQSPVSPPSAIPPVSPPPTGGTPIEMGLMVAFGYNSLVAGAPLRSNLVQGLAVGNGAASYRFPRSGETVAGNLSISVDVTDPDGIARVLVGFNGTDKALVLCENTCGTSFSQTVTGVNPRNFGLTSGSLRLELWLEDLLGNRILFDARDVEWLPQPIVGVNTSRSGSTLQVNWTASNNARRYNLYIAEQPGITPENILSKTGGRQFLALTQPSLSVPSIEANGRYFVLITGVDASGESLFSEQHVVQPVGAPQFSSPTAVADQFSLNEDEEFSGFLLGNDSHPDSSSFSLDSRVVRAPANGSVLLNADGSFVYKPVANFVGNDSFIYQITDTQGLTAQALVTLTLLPVNDQPVALDDNYSLNKNTTLTVDAAGILANDLDIDGDILVVDSIAVTAPAHGSVQLNPNGSFSYTPVANYAGEDFFVYRLTDGQGGVAQAKVTLRIEMTNAAPIALNDSYQVGEDEQLFVTATNGVLSNDTDPDGDSISLVTELIAVTQNGQLLLAVDGSFSYIPRQDFFGTDSFSYQIKDPAGLVSSATVQLRVLEKNDPPVVQGSSYSVNQNTLLTVSAPGLLVHVSDVDDQSLSIVTTAAVAPGKGVLTLSADGAFSYQPTPNATGTDSFIFQVKDAAGAISTGIVVISIIANPTPPVFSDMATEVWDNVTQGTAVAQFSVTDRAPDTTISFSIVGGNPLGIFSLSPAGALSIANPSPLAQLGGASILLTVRAQDSTGLSAQANITIAVRSTAVTAQNDSYSVQEDAVLNSSISVLSNDVDQKASGLTASLITPPAHGSLLLNLNGHFTYNPDANFFGQDSFVYSASNGVRTAQATVTITVSAVNDAPVLTATTFSFSESVAQGAVVGQLVWQDVDANQSYSFSILSGDDTQAFTVTNQGQLVVSDSTALKARGGASGTLLVQITDSAGGTSTALIGLQLQPAFPVINADTYTVNQDSVLQVNAATGVLANDNDPAGLALAITAVSSGPLYGQLNMNSDGSFSYQPNTNFYGQDVFVYQASNGIRTSSAVVTINIVQVLPALQASFDTYTLAEDTLLTVSDDQSLLKNDIFDANQPIVVSLVQAPLDGTLSLNPDGTFTYQPAVNSYGAYYFTYRLTQGTLTSETQVELNITPVNDAPLLQDAIATISDDYANLQHVLTMTQYDADPGSYSYEILSGDSTGVFAITAGGVILVANSSLLDAEATATYNLVVKVTENNDANLTNTATVVINVVAAVQNETAVLPDNSFAGGGNLSLDMMLSGEYNDPVQIIPLSDGRSLVLGNVGNLYDKEFFVVRLNAGGSVDTSYGNKGLFRWKLFSFTEEHLVAGVLVNDNKLVLLVNYTDDHGSGFYLTKLDENGVLDTADFGNSQGYLLCESTPCNSSDVQATSLMLNHLGHYVVSGSMDDRAFLFEFADSGYQAGWVSAISTIKQFDLVRQDSEHNYYGIGQSPNGNIAVARFSSSFLVDSSTFGCTSGCVGYREYNFSSSSSKAYDALLYNDELYVVGSVTDSSAAARSAGLFFKLTYDGSLSTDFGNATGFIQVDGYDDYSLHYKAVTVDASGFYVLTNTADSSNDLVSLSHYNLVGDFIQDQALVVDGGLKAVDLESDGSALWLLNYFSHPEFGFARAVSFNWVGKYQKNTLTADASFSADGQRWFNAGFSEDYIVGSQRLMLGSQVNKTLFYGYSYSYLNGFYRQAFVGRLTSSGALDQSFGNHGLVLLTAGELTLMDVSSVLEATAEQLYVAGFVVDMNNKNTGFVLRLNQNGTMDTSFASGIFSLVPSQFGNYDQSKVKQLELKAGGQLLVGAEYSQSNVNYDIALLQLRDDGSLDIGNFGSSGSGFSLFSEIDSTSETEERLSEMKLDPVDNSLIIAGQHNLVSDPRLYIARFNEAGMLMNATNSPANIFGDAGQGYHQINLVDSSNDQTKYSEYLNALDFDAGSNLVVALATNYQGYESHYLYRVRQNGLVDTTFNFGVPRLYNSFSNSMLANLIIKQIHVDASGRLLLAGTSGAEAWVGRVLLDGSGTDVGRWDPAFEANSSTYGAYVFSGFFSSYDLFMELTSSKVTLGWSNYDSGGYTATLRQYQFYEFQSNPL